MFGNYVKLRRNLLNKSLHEMAESLGLQDFRQLKLIEAGQKKISQEEFELLCHCLDLDPYELANIAKITQVQEILNFYKEVDALYPK